MKATRRSNSRRPFYIALALIALVGTGALLYIASRPKGATVAAIDPSLAPGEARGYVRGDTSAPVEIIEFADFQCPACGRYATITAPDVMRRIVDEGLASYRFYDFPLDQHRNAIPASLAAACANDQGKFWEMHDRIFLGQMDWSDARDPQRIFQGYARELGLNEDAWRECYASRRHVPTILANRDEGVRLGVNQTPTFIIGGQRIPGAISYDEIRRYVDMARARAQSDTAARPAGAR